MHANRISLETRRPPPWCTNDNYLENSPRNEYARNRGQQRKNKAYRKAFLILSSCLATGLLLGLVAGLLVGFLYRPKSLTTTTISTTLTTTTQTTTSTTSVSTTTTTTTATTSTTTTTVSTTTTTSTASTTTTTTTIITTTTTTAFSCSSTFTSTLASYTKGSCTKDTWHTFTNTFVASYTGIQTLVFSFASMSGAQVYITNIKVQDATNVQLLSNGDFSSSSGSTPTNWLQCSTTGQVESTCTYSASSACYATPSAGGSISQSFSVVSGTTYTIQYNLYHNSNTGNSGSFDLYVAVA
ncbi:hypothetical protein I4U23_000257 [Adineta vaga]|nr:hypothetical protein I4U23_000257 [Adineta vaga]